MISPDAEPPVVRLVDFSKFKFEAAKAAKEASKKQRETRCARAHSSSLARTRAASCSVLIMWWQSS